MFTVRETELGVTLTVMYYTVVKSRRSEVLFNNSESIGLSMAHPGRIMFNRQGQLTI